MQRRVAPTALTLTETVGANEKAANPGEGKRPYVGKSGKAHHNGDGLPSPFLFVNPHSHTILISLSRMQGEVAKPSSSLISKH